MRLSRGLLGAALIVLVAAPAHAQKPRREAPVLVPPPAPAATPARPDSSGKSHRPAPTLVSSPARPDSARGAARPAAPPSVATQATHAGAPVAAFSAGLAIAPYDGADDAARDRYLQQFVTQLDSATALLVSVFRNTSGQPMAGADSPAALSARERERWSRCRDLHFDLQSYGQSMRDFVDALPQEPAVQRAGEALDTALTALQATGECDNITSMISAPGRWVPWGSQYTSSARTFYRDWYAQVREVADKNRALALAVNASRPAANRMPVPPALPRTPPYAGAVPR